MLENLYTLNVSPKDKIFNHWWS